MEYDRVQSSSVRIAESWVSCLRSFSIHSKSSRTIMVITSNSILDNHMISEYVSKNLDLMR